jgi:hypothetical protein
VVGDLELQGVLVMCAFDEGRLGAFIGPIRDVRAVIASQTLPPPGGGSGAAGARGLRALGGQLPGAVPGAAAELRVFFDGSVLEVFTGCGSALATRLYTRQLPGTRLAVEGCESAAHGVSGSGGEAGACQLELVAFGAEVVARCEVFEMGSAWEGEGD